MSKKTERTVVVTGGAKGIGRAVCLALAQRGTFIFFNYLSSEKNALETKEMITLTGADAECMCVDVSSEKQVTEFFKLVLDKTGRVDVLVNNAGIAKDNLIARMKISDWEDVINTNMKGVFNCSKAVVRPMMKQRFGRIINISSIVGITGNPGQANYAASKAGIIGFTKSAAKELGSRGITVNAVAPGYVETEMTSSFKDKVKESILNNIPLKRAAKPHEVADLVVFLSSEKASYITGQVINVDGGLY